MCDPFTADPGQGQPKKAGNDGIWNWSQPRFEAQF